MASILWSLNAKASWVLFSIVLRDYSFHNLLISLFTSEASFDLIPSYLFFFKIYWISGLYFLSFIFFSLSFVFIFMCLSRTQEAFATSSCAKKIFSILKKTQDYSTFYISTANFYLFQQESASRYSGGCVQRHYHIWPSLLHFTNSTASNQSLLKPKSSVNLLGIAIVSLILT